MNSLGAAIRFHSIDTRAEATEGDRNALDTCSHAIIELRRSGDDDGGMLSLEIEPRTWAESGYGIRFSNNLGLTLTLDFTLSEAAGLLYAIKCLIKQARWYERHAMPAADADLEAEPP